MAKPRDFWSKNGVLAYIYHIVNNTKTAISQANMNILDGDLALNDVFNPGNGYGLMFNFPANFNIDKVGVKSAFTGTRDIYTSTDSTDGLDGTWVKVVDAEASTSGVYAEHAITADNTNIRWIRCIPSTQNHNYFNFSVFGEYAASDIEFWNAAGDARLNTSQLPFQTDPASNAVDFTADLEFKIKNTTGAERTEVLSVVAVRKGGDTLITDHYKLADGGGDPASSIQVVVAAGAFCANILHILPEVLIADDPGDGYHDFALQSINQP